MGTRWGTSHFQSVASAYRYYRPYHFKDTVDAVHRKLQEGEIHIGRPEVPPGHRAYVGECGQYFIEEVTAGNTVPAE